MALIPAIRKTISWHVTGARMRRAAREMDASNAATSESVVGTADDDVMYPPDWLEMLCEAYRRNPGDVHCHRAHRVSFTAGR